MSSINRQIVHERAARVYDTVAGAQMLPAGVEKYVKALMKSVGMRDPAAGDAADFFRDHGKGI